MDIRKTNNFKYYRERSKYSKKAVADLLDKSVDDIEDFEKGEKAPDANDLLKMMYLYKTSFIKLLGISLCYKNEVIDDIELDYTNKDSHKKYNIDFPTDYCNTLTFYCKKYGFTLNKLLFYLSKEFVDSDPEFINMYITYTKRNSK